MPKGDNPKSRANLKPQSLRTKEEQRQIAKMGGKASGKARAAYKDMRDSLREKLTPEKSDEIMDMLLGKIKEGDLKALEIALRMMGSSESKDRDRLQEAQIAKLKKETEEQTASDVTIVIQGAEDYAD